MTSLAYILWNANPVIAKLGSLPVRWYGLLFVLGFIIAPHLATYIFKKEGKKADDVETIILHLMIGTLMGARLGHVLFYSPTSFLTNPLEALLPVRFSPYFHFSGYEGLSSHGATIGMLIALYLYKNYDISIGLFPPRFRFAKQVRSDQSYLWLTTPLVICATLGCMFIRLGNFMNSEIYGKPTTSKYGVLFAWPITEAIRNSSDAIQEVCVQKVEGTTPFSPVPMPYQPIKLEITFKKGDFTTQEVEEFLQRRLKAVLVSDSLLTPHVYEDLGEALQYTLTHNSQGAYVAHVHTLGVPRHPAQLYEALSCFILFFILFFWWKRRYTTLKDGAIGGVFLLYVFILRFLYEFLKETKVPFGGDFPLNVAQLLSIPAILGGILVLIFAKGKNKQADASASKDPSQ